MLRPHFTCVVAAAFLTVTPYTPQSYLEMAKRQVRLSDKITLLHRLSEAFPLDPAAQTARKDLIALLAGSNRYEEALQLYQQDPGRKALSGSLDLTQVEYLLKTGRYHDVLQATQVDYGPVRDFVRDKKIMELRVQALLAQGYYGIARDCVDRWLARYGNDGGEGSLFEGDVRSIQFLNRHLAALERLQGPKGKPIFTASVPDSLEHWSRRRDVPIVFFKLMPEHPGGQLYEPLLPGRHAGEEFFKARVDDLNRGFDYLSGGSFSLAFQGLSTLYVKEGDLDPEASGGQLLTDRVYVHTIPELYRLAGNAFVVLVDYRAQAGDEAAYMGDGLIHISAAKLQTLVLMHEILHGLGATHQEWNALLAEGYRFDPDDRGLMTFEQGELRYLGLEEKNRALLGWPQVSVVRIAPAEPAGRSATVVATSYLPGGLN